MKIDIKLTDRYRNKYLSLDAAFNAWIVHKLGYSHYSKKNINDYHAKTLNFGEWLDYFNIGIY